VILVGHDNNNAALVQIGANDKGGKLEMRGTSKITGNIRTQEANSAGAGVYITGWGMLEMYDYAEISGNSNAPATTSNSINAYGGGVYLGTNGYCKASVTMNGNSVIKNNTINKPTGGYKQGAGIYIMGTTGSSGTPASAVLTMNDNSAISGNTGAATGGGVYVDAGTVIMNNSTVISGNSASGQGGGVYVRGGILTMGGGTIYGTAVSGGYSNTGTNSLQKDSGATAQYGNGAAIVGVNAGTAGNTSLTITGHN
jgi:hypothetical protein